jgi:hypothetical protein
MKSARRKSEPTIASWIVRTVTDHPPFVSACAASRRDATVSSSARAVSMPAPGRARASTRR